MCRVGPVAYKLLLPSHTRVHDIFHVSLVRKFHGETVDPVLAMPTEFERQQPKLILVTTLHSRKVDVGGTSQS